VHVGLALSLDFLKKAMAVWHFTNERELNIFKPLKTKYTNKMKVQ
jgi:hypothetical protein